MTRDTRMRMDLTHIRKHFRPKAESYASKVKWLLSGFVGLLGLLSAGVHAAEPVNHYIVLFDASGSMKRAHSASYNFWQGQANKNEFMSRRVSKLVDEALRERNGSSDFHFPAISQRDFFSFMLFRLDYDKPSYQLSDMFLTNKELILHQGLPPASAYRSLNIDKVLRGFSPLVAATAGALPFIAERVPAQNTSINRIFIIRITDGSYNADANGADEYSVILQSINRENETKRPRTPYPVHYPAYRALAKQVNAAFVIGAQAKDCFLKTHRINNPFAKPFVCREDAFTELTEEGMGFMISYLEVVPRRPALSTLAFLDKRTLELQPQVQDGELEYVGDNKVSATAVEDKAMHVYPARAEWKIGGESAEWQPCQDDQPIHLLEDSNILDCRGSGRPLRLSQTNGEIPPSDNGAELRDTLEYRLHYKQTFVGRAPLYPFHFALSPPVTLSVRLRITKEALPDNNAFYPSPQNGLASGLPWLDPRRVFGMRSAGNLAQPQPITDELLTEKAHLAAYQAHAPLTPQKLEQASLVDREKYRAQDANYILQARTFYGLLLVLGLIVYLFWPRRILEAKATTQAQDGVVLDFNAREHEPIVLAGIAQVRNAARNLNRGAFRLRVAIEESKFSWDDGGTLKPAPLDIEEGREPLAVGSPGQTVLEDRRAVSDKEYALYFDPSAIKDCRLRPLNTEDTLEISIRVVLEAPRQDTQPLDYTFPLILRPERPRLFPTSHILISTKGVTDLSNKKSGQRQIVGVEYRDGEAAWEVYEYQLKNDTQHHYSRPAQGYLRVAAFQAEREVEGVVRLAVPGQDPTSVVTYSLSHQDVQIFSVAVDFTQLAHPIEQDTFRVAVYRGTGNPENAEGRQSLYEEWDLCVGRSTERTSPSLYVIPPVMTHPGPSASPALNEDRLSLAEPFQVSSDGRPIDVEIGSGGSLGGTLLFSLRLANVCRSGVGFARWRCQLTIRDSAGMEYLGAQLLLLDDQGAEQKEGELKDSSDISERETVLTVELENAESKLRILRQVMRLSVELDVDWQVHEDGVHNPDNVRHFTTNLVLACVLKHKPPPHILAVDFGTAALAIAHAVGADRRLLPLQERLSDIAAEDNKIYRRDNLNGDSPFLSSECSVQADEQLLQERRPNAADFLVLPLLEDTIRSAPDKVFLSLKALISAGLKTLPLPVQKYPYLGPDGQLEKSKEPPLDEVIEGAYRGMMKHYVEPILEHQGLAGFSTVLITYPNTYTPNHIEQLREIANKVFVGYPIPLPNIVYEENIEFYSESDAVAFYYLVHAWELHGRDWSKVPDSEQILVYDIGAGTLDLTHLEVQWETSDDEDGMKKTPNKILIKRRAGANRAGNLLDECIARDLHEYLKRELQQDPEDERYTKPIVVSNKKKMDAMTRHAMDQLRQQIHQLKVELSNGHQDSYKVLLTPTEVREKIVQVSGGRTASLYTDYEQITVENNEVYWTPTRETVLNGRYVKAFLEQVTRQEIRNFFGGDVPPLDTVIVSGRTSLWPGFQEHLQAAVGNGSHWVSFNNDSTELKQAVVMGVMERHSRWPDLVVEDPHIIGDFVVRFEHTPRNWREHVFSQSGDSHNFNLADAEDVKIGIRTSNGFHECFRFTAHNHSGSDKKLEITLNFDQKGLLQAEAKNNRGEVKKFRDLTNVATLPYTDRPWPLGASMLQELEPTQVVAGDTLEDFV